MIEVEILGAAVAPMSGAMDGPPAAGYAAAVNSAATGTATAALPSEQEVRRLCALATDAAGIDRGHLAIEFVDARRIAELNGLFRAKQQPTDVLSFPIDGVGPAGGERELGDVVICLEYTSDVREAIVHGVLHLLGMDHETDAGEMLALQRELLSRGNA
jgi:probable rRNA maturation factor